MLSKNVDAWLLVGMLAGGSAVAAPAEEPGLLFYLSGEKGLTADAAGGAPAPTFVRNVTLIDDGAQGRGLRCAEGQVLAYRAPGNIYAQRGTLSFFWRAREPIGSTPFPIFRVGYQDHSSWDMVFLRVDYNGHGFDAFVTDASLARTRVSHQLKTLPRPEQWLHFAVAWDETVGLRLWIDGALVGRKDAQAVYDAGLDQFGPHSRVISPYQVQSAYCFLRGGDIDEIRIYDRLLADEQVTRLARKQPVSLAPLTRSLAETTWRDEWWLRYGWNRPADAPPYLETPATRVRKVEIHDAFDLKQWMWKGSDGIRETTWPGVYNRSRLPGRTDYFILPDWNCYSRSGKSITFTLPDEAWNHVEIQGSAYGPLSAVDGSTSTRLATRPAGQERTFHRLARPRTSGQLRFDNDVQETPIGELQVYHVSPGEAPAGMRTLRYSLSADEAPDEPSLAPLMEYIRGRFVPDERGTVVAAPENPSAARGRMLGPRRRGPVGVTPAGERGTLLPLVHVLIPCDLRQPAGAEIERRRFSYTWENLNGGLDGIAIDLPALDVQPTHGDFFPLNIQVKDPIWPERTLLDFSFSVKPNEARTLFLDTRDRILPNDRSLYLTIAAAGADFRPRSLQGAGVRLIFKGRSEAAREHVADRFMQVRDNYGFTVEEHPNDRRLRLFERFDRDVSDLFRVDPDHELARTYWADNNPEQAGPPFVQPQPPDGVPLWAFRQVEVLKNLRRFVNWWIDERQIDNGELGGGLSDDGDLTNQWVPAALMGIDSDKIKRSVLRMMDEFYVQGMFTNGLATILTDELHSYEEGISVIPQTMLLDYGSPKAVERLMETTRGVERVVAVNAAGHRHITSSFFSGTRVVREGVWEWAKPSSYLLLHPAIALVEFNGLPRAKTLLLEMADGHLAHRRKDQQGRFFMPAEIHFSSDADRGSDPSRALFLFWAAWSFSGDAKYLAPIRDAIDSGRVDVADGLNVNWLALPEMRATWADRIAREVSPASGNDYLRHLAWQVTGNKQQLEALYGDQLQRGAQSMYMNTEGHWWSDRVYMPSAELQRARLGGVALLRNRIPSGQLVSWSFRAPATAASVAILVQPALPDEVKILAYNLSAAPVEAALTAWNVKPGEWDLAIGPDANGDDAMDSVAQSRRVPFERTRSLDVSFAPRVTTVITLRWAAAARPLWERPELGIDPEDVAVDKGIVRVKVHSLGSVVAPAARVVLLDAQGATLAAATTPEIPAPLDLTPKTAAVSLRVPGGRSLAGGRVVIDPDGQLVEITSRNNSVTLQ